MRSRLASLAAVATATFILLSAPGCGGKGGSTPVDVGAFAGNWTGSYADPDVGFFGGESTWTISQTGEVSSSNLNPGNAAVHHYDGRIDASGNFAGHLTLGGHSFDARGTFSVINSRFVGLTSAYDPQDRQWKSAFSYDCGK